MIVEITSIEFEELHHQHTQVPGWINLSSPDLRVHLQKRNRQTDDAVAPKSAAEHLVHRTLTQERLDDEHKRAERREFFEEPKDHFASKNTVDVVDADVDGEVTVVGDEFDDWDFGFCYDRHVVRDPCTLHCVCEGAKDGDLVHVCHVVGLDDQIYITSKFGLSTAQGKDEEKLTPKANKASSQNSRTAKPSRPGSSSPQPW